MHKQLHLQNIRYAFSESCSSVPTWSFCWWIFRSLLASNSVLQRCHCAIRETYTHVLHRHVRCQKLLESDHSVSRCPIERIAHRPGVWITRVTNTTIAGSIVTSLSVRLCVLHLLWVDTNRND